MEEFLWDAKHAQKLLLLEFFKISVLKSTHFGKEDEKNQYFSTGATGAMAPVNFEKAYLALVKF